MKPVTAHTNKSNKNTAWKEKGLAEKTTVKVKETKGGIRGTK